MEHPAVNRLEKLRDERLPAVPTGRVLNADQMDAQGNAIQAASVAMARGIAMVRSAPAAEALRDEVNKLFQGLAESRVGSKTPDGHFFGATAEEVQSIILLIRKILDHI